MTKLPKINAKKSLAEWERRAKWKAPKAVKRVYEKSETKNAASPSKG